MTVGSARVRTAAHGQLRSLVWGLVVVDLAVIGLAAWTLLHSRGRYVTQAKVTTHNLALVLEQNLKANVRQIDLVLQSVRDEAERLDAKDRQGGIEAHVQAQFSRVALLDSLRTLDADGILDHVGGADPGPSRDLSRSALFQHLRTAHRSELHLSRPTRDGAGQAWVITLARRMERADGSLRGVVLATVRLDHLTRELAQVDVGKAGSISLRGGGLELLARYPGLPGQEDAIGDTHISGDYLLAVESGQQVSQFTTSSSLDGQVRTYTFRRLLDPPLYVLVGMAQQDYLADWRREALLSGLAVTGLIAFSLGTAWMASRAWRRQIRDQAERDRLIEDLTQALAEVRNLKGMLPICGHCKKIRDDSGYWNHLESYISEHTEATFTHGVCPDCARDLRQEMQARRGEPDQA